MNNVNRCLFILGLAAGLILSAGPEKTRAQTDPVFVTIGSGDVTGVYFPAGLTIARIINAKRQTYGIRAAVESTRGSVFNINAISAGYMAFGLAQSDKQYQAVHGLAEWEEKAPQAGLRSVFSLHHESVNLVAAVDAGITTIADLKGKRVNLGNPGSGQYQNAMDALIAAGLDPREDIQAETARASEGPDMLQGHLIDAFFCTLGHPSGTLVEATSGERKVRFIPVSGPGIDRMVAERGYYTKTILPVVTFYPGAQDPVAVETFGVVATLCASSRLPAHVVYAVTKEVFENLDDFRKEHPAFAGLTPEGMLTGLSAPFHPGAIRYFQEAGLMK